MTIPIQRCMKVTIGGVGRSALVALTYLGLMLDSYATPIEPFSCLHKIWDEWDPAHIDFITTKRPGDFKSKNPTYSVLQISDDFKLNIDIWSKKVVVEHFAPENWRMSEIEKLYHEIFHYTHQKRYAVWMPLYRGSRFEIDASLKFKRRRFVEEFSRKVEFGDDICESAMYEDLHAAQRVADPQNFQHFWSMDRIEGSATYVGLMATSYRLRGCAAPDSVIHATYLQDLHRIAIPQILQASQGGHEWLSYAIGGIYGYYYSVCKKDRSWMKNIDDGQNMTNALQPYVRVRP